MTLTIKINQPKLIEFINKNKDLDIEVILTDFIPLIEYCVGRKTETIEDTKSSISYLLEEIKNQNMLNIEKQQCTQQMQDLQIQNISKDFENKYEIMLTHMKNTLSTNSHQIEKILSNSNSKSQEEIVNDIKSILSSHQKDINNLLNNTNDKELFQEIVKSGNDKVQTLISQNHKDIEALVHNKNENTVLEQIVKCGNEKVQTLIEKTIQSQNDKIQHILSQNHTEINNILSTTNDKTEIQRILKENNTEMLGHYNQSLQTQLNSLQSAMLDITNTLTNSSKKGAVSENRIEILLSQSFPSYHIQNTHKIPHSGDFIVTHPICDKILIENKDYKTNVDKQEIDKFLHDVNKQECHGILMSQNSGIANKEHFGIEYNDDKILLYVHNVQYDPEIIKICFSIIENISRFHQNASKNDKNTQIEQEKIDTLFTEWKELQKNHDIVIQSLKNSISKLKEQHLPSLQSIFESTLPDKFSLCQCKFCGLKFQNNKSLTNHVRSCKHKPSTSPATSSS